MPKFIPLSTLKDTTFICDMCQQIKEPIFVTRNGYTEALKNTGELSKRCAQTKNAIHIIKNGVGELVIMSLEVYNTCKERVLVALKKNKIDFVN